MLQTTLRNVILSPLLLTSLAFAQGAEPQGATQNPAPRAQQRSQSPVQRVLVLFKGADSNQDKKLEPKEAAKAGIRGADFATYDHNSDRAWDPDEFLVYYHRLLGRAGHTTDPALDQAVARVQEARQKAAERQRLARQEAARKAREQAEQTVAQAEPAPEASQPTAGESQGDATQSDNTVASAGGATQVAPAQPTAQPNGTTQEPKVADAAPQGAPAAGSDASLREKLNAAKSDLEERAANADGATREQFDAAAAQLDERARAAAGVQPQGSDNASENPAQPAEKQLAQGAEAQPESGEPTVAQGDPLREKLDAAKSDLQKRAAGAEGATREQYDAAAAQLDERARNAARQQPQAGEATAEEPEIDAKLAAALKAIETRGRAAGASPEAIEQQKAQLIARARGASQPQEQPGGETAQDIQSASVPVDPGPVVLGADKRKARRQADLKPAGAEGTESNEKPAGEPTAGTPEQRMRAAFQKMVQAGHMPSADAQRDGDLLAGNGSARPVEVREALKRAQTRLKAALDAGDLDAEEARAVGQWMVQRAQASASQGAAAPKAERPNRPAAGAGEKTPAERRAERQAQREQRAGSGGAQQKRPGGKQAGQPKGDIEGRPARGAKRGGQGRDGEGPKPKRRQKEGDDGR